ncbi:MAG: pilus assembly protein [Anaerolineae bacterium]|nr:pilus assembly protein [Anaerolineae bacterium]
MDRAGIKWEAEDGQSMLEMTVGTVFLLLIVLILFEMAMLFYSYIAVLNASREGALFASSHPELASDVSSPYYATYLEITRAEANAAGLVADETFLVIDRPELLEGSAEPLDPIMVTVHYQLINPTQGIILPVLGRMGLFQSAWMSAATRMPIR